MKQRRLVRQILELSEATPERVFSVYLSLTNKRREMTYAQLVDGAKEYSTLFSSLQLGKGEVVGIILENSPDLAMAFLGALFVGAVPTILSPPSIKISSSRYSSMLSAMIERSNARLIVTNGRLKKKYEQLIVRPDANVRMCALDDSRNPSTSFSQVMECVDEGAPVFLQHSSGTTGLQKGVVVTNRTLALQLGYLKNAIQAADSDSIISWLPLYHDMGLVACFLFPLYWGIKVIQIPTFDWLQRPSLLLDGISEEKATLCWLPNFAYLFLANKAKETGRRWDLSSLRLVINCSEKVTQKAHKSFSDRFVTYGFAPKSLSSSYAMAENVFAVTQSEPGKKAEEIQVEAKALQDGRIKIAESRERVFVSSGRLIEGTKLSIVDTQGKHLPPDVIGEIVISGECLFREYFHNPKATTAVIMDGWYSTGDVGFIHEGELYVIGRKKDLIIVGGKNIYPQDIEDAVNECREIHPGRVVAFGVFDEELGTDKIVLLVERSQSKSLTDLQIKEEMRKLITVATDNVVDDVHVVPPNWLLKSTSGKISRSMNREKFLKELQPTVALPRDPE